METKRIGEILLSAGEITPEDLNIALHYQEKNGGLLGMCLVREGATSYMTVIKYLSLQGANYISVRD